MKQVIAFLRPNNHRDHPMMEWWYFMGFDWHYDLYDPNIPAASKLETTRLLSKAYIITDYSILLAIQERLRVHHQSDVAQVFSISDKTLFEARLKGT